jgi:hypothetical protein
MGFASRVEFIERGIEYVSAAVKAMFQLGVSEMAIERLVLLVEHDPKRFDGSNIVRWEVVNAAFRGAGLVPSRPDVSIALEPRWLKPEVGGIMLQEHT